MAKLTDITSIWSNIREIDLRALREEALRILKVAVIGRQGVGRHTLADQMRSDPARPDLRTQSPVMIASLEEAASAAGADLIILMVNADQEDVQMEQELALRWSNAGKRVVIFINQFEPLAGALAQPHWLKWPAERILYGTANDTAFLQHELVPVVMELMRDRLLALGRQFPLFRVRIAHDLINDTCVSNTAYALSTGLAEIVPVLDLPLNITDMIVLTKSQAFLAYKLGLEFGFSTQWRDYVAEFGSVIGGGFVWRQLARQLVGLIPVWGIIPKVAVAYAGTFVVGNVILQWYLTGRHLSASQMRGLYLQAFARGKIFAQKVGEKLPRPKLGRRKRAELPVPESSPRLPSPSGEGILALEASQAESLVETAAEATASQTAPTSQAAPGKRYFWQKKEARLKSAGSGETGGEISKSKKRLARRPKSRSCEQCGKPNAADAIFCQYCGVRLTNL